MNKKYNLLLNISETILTIICLFLIVLFGKYKLDSVEFNSMLFFISILIFETAIVLIEAFLFLLYKKKYKYLYIGYMLSFLIITLFVNSNYLLYGIFTLSLCSIIKSFIRIKYIKYIYVRGSFKKYCKIFNIKLEKEKLKVTKVKPAVGKVINTSSKKKIRSKAEKSYA